MFGDQTANAQARFGDLWIENGRLRFFDPDRHQVASEAAKIPNARPSSRRRALAGQPVHAARPRRIAAGTARRRTTVPHRRDRERGKPRMRGRHLLDPLRFATSTCGSPCAGTSRPVSAARHRHSADAAVPARRPPDAHDPRPGQQHRRYDGFTRRGRRQRPRRLRASSVPTFAPTCVRKGWISTISPASSARRQAGGGESQSGTRGTSRETAREPALLPDRRIGWTNCARWTPTAPARGPHQHAEDPARRHGCAFVARERPAAARSAGLRHRRRRHPFRHPPDARESAIRTRADVAARGSTRKLLPEVRLGKTAIGKVGGDIAVTGTGNSIARILGSADGDARIQMAKAASASC